ncbi:hypothetical protein C8R45DRAFT_1032839 [Mycena sanguinolenta]|nr:hypothetical protein C8R45DRAFT_1032839 [Mycena sanguinolenta]
MHLLLFLRVLHHSLATPSTEGLLGCRNRHSREMGCHSIARDMKLVETRCVGNSRWCLVGTKSTPRCRGLSLAIQCDLYHSMYAMRPGRR